MSKIKLGAAPKNFKKTVTFPMLDGTTGSIEVTYTYRTRTQFGAFIDGINAAAGKEAAAEKFSLEAFMATAVDSNADYVLQVAEGWDLDAEFTLDSIKQLADEVPAAAHAIMEGYRAAIAEGRLGN